MRVNEPDMKIWTKLLQPGRTALRKALVGTIEDGGSRARE